MGLDYLISVLTIPVFLMAMPHHYFLDLSQQLPQQIRPLELILYRLEHSLLDRTMQLFLQTEH